MMRGGERVGGAHRRYYSIHQTCTRHVISTPQCYFLFGCALTVDHGRTQIHPNGR